MPLESNHLERTERPRLRYAVIPWTNVLIAIWLGTFISRQFRNPLKVALLASGVIVLIAFASFVVAKTIRLRKRSAV